MVEKIKKWISEKYPDYEWEDHVIYFPGQENTEFSYLHLENPDREGWFVCIDFLADSCIISEEMSLDFDKITEALKSFL